MRKTMSTLALPLLAMGICGCAHLFQYTDNPVDIQKTIFIKKGVHVYSRQGPGRFTPRRKTDEIELHQYIELQDDRYGLWTPKGEPFEWVPRNSTMTPEEKEMAEKYELELEKKKIEENEMKKKERTQKLKKYGYIIERVWVDSQIDTAYALVTYQNFSKETYQRVSIKCVGIGNGNQRIGVNSRSFMGGVYPGFVGTEKIPIELNGAQLESISCERVEYK